MLRVLFQALCQHVFESLPLAKYAKPKSLVAPSRYPNTIPADLTFPDISAYDLLHLPRSATSREIKRRFLELAKVYVSMSSQRFIPSGKELNNLLFPPQHPDKQMQADDKTREDSENKFAQLKAAFDLLGNDHRRNAFLRSGLGWHSGSSPTSGGRKYATSDDIPYDLRHNPWGQPRTSRTYSYSHHRGPYPSAPWDWPHMHDEFYTSNHTHNHNNDADRPVSNKNLFRLLLAGSLSFYLYNIAVSVPENDPERISAAGGSGLKVMEDRHEFARKALVDAREQAKLNAAARRQQIRGHAKLLELEAGQAGQTGHMPSMELKSLPPPSTSLPPPPQHHAHSNPTNGQ